MPAPSDRYGRQPILLGGFGIYFVATIACALAPNVQVLIAARGVLGLAAAVSPAAGRAVVRDLWSGDQAARAMSYVVMAMTIAPLIAPTLGGFIISWWDWRMIFWMLLFFAALALLLIITRLPETNGPEKRGDIRLGDYFLAYGQVLKAPLSWAYMLCGGLSTATMFAYITGASYVYITIFGIDPNWFGAFFAINVIGLFLGNWLNSRLVVKWGYHKLLGIGCSITLLGATSLFMVNKLGGHSLLSMVIGLFVTVAPVSMVSSNCNVGLLNCFPRNAGAASALFGVAQFGLGALASLMVGLLFNGTPLAMCLSMFITAIASLLAMVWLQCLKRSESSAQTA